MATVKQLNLMLSRKKEKSSKLTAENKIVKEEIKQLKEQIAALKDTETKSVSKKKTTAKKDVKKKKK